MKKYLVVGFPEEGTMEVIPSTWLISKNLCYWPCGKEAKNWKAKIMNCVLPLENWSQSHMKIYAGSNSFTNAYSKCEEALYTSNIESDSSEGNTMKKRAIKKPDRYQSDCDSEEEAEESQSLIETSRKAKPSRTKIYSLPVPPPMPNDKILFDRDNNILENVSPVSSRAVSDKMGRSSAQSQDTSYSFLNTPSARAVSEKMGRSSAQSQDTSYSFLNTPSTQEVEEFSTNDPVLKNILKHLLDQKQQIKLLTTEVKKLREKVDLKLQTDENPQVAAAIGGIVSEDFPNLPLINLGELESLEKLITSEPAKATALARYLCRGNCFKNANSLILQVLKRLLGRELALQYSLEGRQGKLKFGNLNIFHVVIAFHITNKSCFYINGFIILCDDTTLFV